MKIKRVTTDLIFRECEQISDNPADTVKFFSHFLYFSLSPDIKIGRFQLNQFQVIFDNK